jgi:uncharacterized protein YjbI with pentapeptide repeats
MDDEREHRARELVTAVKDGVSGLRGGLTRFATAALYIWITLGSTTDEQLVRGSTVTLPVVNIAIPMTGPLGFCMLAPVMILGLHISLLVQLATLRATMTRLLVARKKLTTAPPAELAERIPAPYYLRYLVSEVDGRSAGSALALLGTIVGLPLLLLVAIQLRFLPLHYPQTTLLQQAIVAADVAVALVLLWDPLSRRVALQDEVPARPALVRGVASPWMLVLVLGVAVLVFSTIANIPGAREGRGGLFGRRNLQLEGKTLGQDQLSPEQINTLRDGTPAQREDILRKVSRLSMLQGHDLRYANLRRAILPAVDFRSERDPITGEIVETNLEHADLSWTVMPQVLLDDVNLRQATLRSAYIQGGVLNRANLEQADLRGAELQDAKLSAARLRAARLDGASLAGADLSRADLRDADLSGVQAQSAMLRDADLRGADLRDADLRGADLSGAHLQGTKLTGARIDGAILRGVVVRDAFDQPCKLRYPARLGSSVDQLAAAECRMRDIVGPGCDDIYDVATMLAELACNDPYVARGLSTQVLYNAPGRYPIARALVGPDAGTKCVGVGSLPESVRAGLDKGAKAPPPAG